MFVINYSHKINSINYTIFRRRNSYHCYRQGKTPTLCHCKTKNSHSNHIRGSSLENAIAAEAEEDIGKAEEAPAAAKAQEVYHDNGESSGDDIFNNTNKSKKKSAVKQAAAKKIVGAVEVPPKRSEIQAMAATSSDPRSSTTSCNQKYTMEL